MRRYALVGILGAVLLCSTPPAGAQSGGPYTLSGTTIDNGGATFSTGSSSSLGGTTGQPEAGALMSGSSYMLSGGIWSELSAPQPLITSGVTAGSTRVFGHGAANIPCGQVQIWSAGPNGLPEGGTDDDELLGNGCTDAQGNFHDSPGIGLSRPVMPGEVLFAIDRQNNFSGPPVTVVTTPPPPPTTTPTPTPVTIPLSSVDLRASREVGRSSISLKTTFDASPLGNVEQVLSGGATVAVSGAGLHAAETMTFPGIFCFQLGKSHFQCIGTMGEVANFKTRRSSDLVTVTITAQHRSFPPPLTTAGVTVDLSLVGYRLDGQIGSCTVRGKGTSARCPK